MSYASVNFIPREGSMNTTGKEIKFVGQKPKLFAKQAKKKSCPPLLT
jgi:hypothetical protein